MKFEIVLFERWRDILDIATLRSTDRRNLSDKIKTFSQLYNYCNGATVMQKADIQGAFHQLVAEYMQKTHS